MPKTKYNILYVYNETQTRLRVTVEDLIKSFERHSGHRCFYFNTFGPRFPDYLRSIKFDIIVFNALFLGQRNNPPSFFRARETVLAVRDLDCVKIAMPQDEYMHCDLLCDFINEFGVTHVLSLGAPADWPAIYRTVDRQRVVIKQILAGYLEPSTVARIEKIVAATPAERPLDIGYRAWYSAPWLGRRAQLKGRIADVFSAVGPRAGFRVDIETDLNKVFVGDDWYRFLARCRFSLGAEGGSGIADHDGSIRARAQEYLRLHPKATFDEIEAANFPGIDGKLHHFMITPRHLECCVTRTCQVLMEGDYNGILQPDVHYIPVKSDFSNVDEALDRMRDEGLRRRIVDRAYRDIVASRRYEYGEHVREVLELVSLMLPVPAFDPIREARSALTRARLRLQMALAAWLVFGSYKVLRLVFRSGGGQGRAIVRRLPVWAVNCIRRLLPNWI